MRRRGLAMSIRDMYDDRVRTRRGSGRWQSPGRYYSSKIRCSSDLYTDDPRHVPTCIRVEFVINAT